MYVYKYNYIYTYISMWLIDLKISKFLLKLIVNMYVRAFCVCKANQMKKF